MATQIEADLAKSGLKIEDMGVRTLDAAERAATMTPMAVNGYVIPYYDVYGKPNGFYRVRLFHGEMKYKQVKDSGNHVYFPRGFLKAVEGKDYVVFTEGEKKASCLVSRGIPAIAFGGVDSWRNRIVVLPPETALSTGKAKGSLQAKMPSGGEVTEDVESSLAVGFQDLIDLVLKNKLRVVIVYDTDQDTGVSYAVQRAAATLGFELRFRGIPFVNIRQCYLPKIISLDYTSKSVGIDDYVMFHGVDSFATLVKECLAARGAFPRYPSIRDYVNKKLQRSKLSRKEIQNVGLAILSDMDANGIRLRSPSGYTFYFDRTTKKLYQSEFALSATDANLDGAFSQFIYHKYGLSSADARILVWLGAQFTGEEPIENVQPHRVFAKPELRDNHVTFQLSDSEYVIVRSTGIEIHPNGDGGVLFESDQVEQTNIELLKREYQLQSGLPITNWWSEVLSEVRLRDREKQKVATSLLYYLSPWLHRWRGMQLPIELILGEAGSGKSTLCELRLQIITGRPILRNAPADLKDWHASVSNSGGLHITDNVQLLDRNLRQRLSDELCRIVTEADPMIEQRKFFTNNELMRAPVRAVFAITAIQQPFQNADLLQRSMLLELDKTAIHEGQQMTYDSDWKQQMIKRKGGREAWLAHHFLVLQKFLKMSETMWKPHYQARHRLINFEQAMNVMAELFMPGITAKKPWVSDYLQGMTNKVISENDWALQGLIEFADMHRGKLDRCSVKEVVDWAETEDDYCKCEALVNPRKLGRYMKTHKGLVQALTGLFEAGMYGNKVMYKLLKPTAKIPVTLNPTAEDFGVPVRPIPVTVRTEPPTVTGVFKG